MVSSRLRNYSPPLVAFSREISPSRATTRAWSAACVCGERGGCVGRLFEPLREGRRGDGRGGGAGERGRVTCELSASRLSAARRDSTASDACGVQPACESKCGLGWGDGSLVRRHWRGSRLPRGDLGGGGTRQVSSFECKHADWTCARAGDGRADQKTTQLPLHVPAGSLPAGALPAISLSLSLSCQTS